MRDKNLISGSYGPDYRHGVITDHVGRWVDGGARLHVTASGRQVLVADGMQVPVLCGEIVPLHTEDGVTDGRCGSDVFYEDDACPGHESELRHWRNASEVERYAIERAEERV